MINNYACIKTDLHIHLWCNPILSEFYVSGTKWFRNSLITRLSKRYDRWYLQICPRFAKSRSAALLKHTGKSNGFSTRNSPFFPPDVLSQSAMTYALDMSFRIPGNSDKLRPWMDRCIPYPQSSTVCICMIVPLIRQPVAKDMVHILYIKYSLSHKSPVTVRYNLFLYSNHKNTGNALGLQLQPLTQTSPVIILNSMGKELLWCVIQFYDCRIKFLFTNVLYF